MIEKGESEYATKIRKIVLVQFVRMSSDKFARFEAVIILATLSRKHLIFGGMSLLKRSSSTYPPIMRIQNSNLYLIYISVQFLQLMMDSFGNYVAQRIFNKGDESLKRKIFSLLQSIDPEAINSNNFSIFLV